MNLRQDALDKLRQVYKDVIIVSQSPSVCFINSYPTNVRTASEKSGDKFWFDVTPELYERRQVEFFIYVCGSPDLMYVFPRLNFEHLIRGASLGGQKQVPIFTIFTSSDDFEPAGLADKRRSIGGFRNAFFLIPPD